MVKINFHRQETNSRLNEGESLTFIHLKDKNLVEYDIIYYVDHCYNIKQLSEFRSDSQLLFKKFSSRGKQLNLLYVDTLFPKLLADVALEAFLKGVSSFYEYTFLHRMFVVVDSKTDKKYFENKFKSFINLLLFSNIATKDVFKEVILQDAVYYMKEGSMGIRYFTGFERNELLDLLFKGIKLEINLSKSSISNSKREVNLHFKIHF